SIMQGCEIADHAIIGKPKSISYLLTIRILFENIRRSYIREVCIMFFGRFTMRILIYYYTQ
ncbi:hypothetical protein ABTE31_19280, partial [Acinetobacter baumannii]